MEDIRHATITFVLKLKVSIDISCFVIDYLLFPVRSCPYVVCPGKEPVLSVDLDKNSTLDNQISCKLQTMNCIPILNRSYYQVSSECKFKGMIRSSNYIHSSHEDCCLDTQSVIPLTLPL